jgi:hydrogenase maturation protease
VVGVGNAYRGDDAAGLAVVARLQSRVPTRVRLAVCELEPSRLLDAWDEAETAVVVDAVSSGAPAGTVQRFDASEQPLPARGFLASTHAIGLGEAVELARTLGRLPRRVVVYGIEGADFTAGAPLSSSVEEAVEQVAAELAGEFAAGTSGAAS